MKKILYSALMAAWLLGVLSCTDLLDPKLRNLSDVRQDIPEGATLTLAFSVPTEIATKAAMANDPDIETIHVFVFNEEGTLLQVRPATLGATTLDKNYDPNATDAEKSRMVKAWTVDNIMMSADKRILHFVANLPADKVPQSGSETSIFQALSVEAPNAAYWQRVELDNIYPYSYKGQKKYSYIDSNGKIVDPGENDDDNVPNAASATQESDGTWSYTDANGYKVSKDDYIDHDGNKIVNGTGYYYFPPEGTPLHNMIPMVRNFARIEFINTWTAFKPHSIALVNKPKSGLVAPFNPSASGKFVQEYMDLVGKPTGTLPNCAAITDYAPSLLGDGIDTSFPTSFTSVGADGKATLFMYERDVPNEQAAATCILVGGILNDYTTGNQDIEVWFKFEVEKAEDGSYFPFYRGFNYPVELQSIDNSSVRHRTAERAFNAVPVGDISSSPVTSMLDQITDGEGLTLWVSYVDYSDLEGKKTVPLLYTFFYEDPSQPGTIHYYPADVTVSRSRKSGVNLGYATSDNFIVHNDVPFDENSPYWAQYGNQVIIPDPTLQWYLIEVELLEKESQVRQSCVKVEGKLHGEEQDARTLDRLVTYTVMDQQRIGLEVTNIEADEADQSVKLTISLPSILQPHHFPLAFYIEAYDNNLTPTTPDVTITTPPLSVESGPSTFEDKTGNTFYFLKIINYDDYFNTDGTVKRTDFTCYLRTTKSTGKTPVTKIRVTERTTATTSWFLGGDDATIDLKVGPIFQISKREVSVGANETSVTFNIKSTGDENPTWTLTRSANVTSLLVDGSEGYSGSGNATITVNFPANTSISEPVTYKVTASRTGRADRVLEITQHPVPYTFNASEFSVNNNSSSKESNDEHVSISLAQVTLTGTGTTAYLTLGRRASGTTYRGNITVTPLTGYKITEIKVTYTNADNASYDFNNTNGVSVDSGTYTRDSSDGSTATWTGSTSTGVTFTNGYTNSGYNYYYFPQISSIAVTCEKI